MIHLNSVDFGYQKSESLFSDLSLDIEQGGIYGLLGRNGAGKSSLLKLMTGCIRPDAGTVQLFGRGAFLRDPAILQRLYFLPEQVYLPANSWQVLAKAYGSFYPKFDLQAFNSGLEVFEVPTNRKLTKLSLGQKKKGLIAFALACNTDLLVLDEPTNGLDIPSKAQLRSILASTVDDDRAIVVSTHQVRDLAGLIDPVLIVDAGRIIANLDLNHVSERLSFSLESTMTAPADALHAERVAGGHYVVRHNTTGQHTEPDLEVLFNAIIARNSPVLQALNASTPSTLKA